jgi:predicted TIM-barrel fold metal-dependent hydrolase
MGGPDKGDGASQSPDEIIRQMDSSGVDRAVVFSLNEVDPGPSFSKANDSIAASVKRFPKRLVGFARLDPNAGENSLKELERAIVELGLKGVKLHPKAQNFTPRNPYVLSIVRRAGEHGVPVVFDNGKDIFPNTAIGSLSKKAKDTNIIMAHMRGPGFIEVPKANENVYLGSVKAEPGDLKKAFFALGGDKIIAGSDSPYAEMRFEINEKFELIEGLIKKDLENICGGNMERMLGLNRV